MTGTYHRGLAAIARRTGFPVIEVAGWQTRGKDSNGNPAGMVARPTGVDCHHTASGRLSGDIPTLGILTYGRSDLRNSLCAYGLARSGRIYVVAAGQSWHAGLVYDTRFDNAHAFGIEAENDGIGERWPAAQMEAYARLCAELCRAFGIPPSMVRDHREICYPAGRKIDRTGIASNAFRSAVAARLANPTASEDLDMNDADMDKLAGKIGEAVKNELVNYRMKSDATGELSLGQLLVRQYGEMSQYFKRDTTPTDGGTT
jgi:hypothetical protein